MLMLSSEELGDQRRRSRASPNPWLIGLCFDVVWLAVNLLMTTEGGDMVVTEEGNGRGTIHNYIVTFLTPKCNLCNLGDNLGASPLNSLNLIDR